jgi:hypothetical protein
MTKSETYTTHIHMRDRTYIQEEPISADELADTITRLCEVPETSIVGKGVVGLEEALIVDSENRFCVKIIGRDIILPSNLAARQTNFRSASESDRAAAILEAVDIAKSKNKPARLYV